MAEEDTSRLTLDVDDRAVYHLASLEQALITAVTAPVVLPSKGYGPCRIEPFSHIFYDCVDNEQQAVEIMLGRMNSASHNIQEHMTLFGQFVDSLARVRKAFNQSNRRQVSEEGFNLASQLHAYTILVDRHQRKLGWRGFLIQPTCPSGHYFLLPGEKRIVPVLHFNPEQTTNGAQQDTEKLEDALNDCGEHYGPLPALDDGPAYNLFRQGPEMTSLKHYYQITKGLLARIG